MNPEFFLGNHVGKWKKMRGYNIKMEIDLSGWKMDSGGS
jgi:hypothetical protein